MGAVEDEQRRTVQLGELVNALRQVLFHDLRRRLVCRGGHRALDRAWGGPVRHRQGRPGLNLGERGFQGWFMAISSLSFGLDSSFRVRLIVPKTMIETGTAGR